MSLLWWNNNPIKDLILEFISNICFYIWISLIWFWVIGAITMYSAPWAEWWLWIWLPSIVIYIGVTFMMIALLTL